jgi:hypothetical protein
MAQYLYAALSLGGALVDEYERTVAETRAALGDAAFAAAWAEGRAMSLEQAVEYGLGEG